MRIVIDCFKQIKGIGKSIEIYNVVFNLIVNLVEYRRNTDDKHIKDSAIIVLGNKYNKEDFNMEGVEFIQIDNYNPLNKIHCVIWELLAVSSICKKMNADRVVFPRGFCALTHPVRDSIIVHDFIPFYYHTHFPETFNKLENAYIMNRLRSSVKTCDQVIAISEASKIDIVKYCGIDENKITVIHNGCNKMSHDGEKVLPSKTYICAITSALPHKNAVGIFNSYQKYCEIADEPLDLTIIGISDTSCMELPEKIKSKITCYKFIKENSELHKIIANSSIFLFLSLIEGFGFPPIEAMQLKVPVICSKASSLPEIVGDAAVLVNPKNPEEVAEAIDDLVNNIDKQAELIAKGNENIKRFDWEDKARLYWKEFTKQVRFNETEKKHK